MLPDSPTLIELHGVDPTMVHAIEARAARPGVHVEVSLQGETLVLALYGDAADSSAAAEKVVDWFLHWRRVESDRRFRRAG